MWADIKRDARIGEIMPCLAVALQRHQRSDSCYVAWSSNYLNLEKLTNLYRTANRCG